MHVPSFAQRLDDTRWRPSRYIFVLGLIFLLLGAVSPVQAQQARAYGVTYRPDVEYRVWTSDHFDLVYQTGAEDMAQRTVGALEATYAGTDSLVGLDHNLHMPVVINNFNDRSNGFVDPLPFRQEIEAPSIKSDALVARASSWPAAVAPHELVHAAHADVSPSLGVGGLLRPFAPDVVRSLNLLAPSGFTEGVAVYRESRIDPDAGRLNAPLFQMKMKAAMLSDDPWSLTQMLEAPTYTQPFNRHYNGGGHAFEYLAERGDSVSTDFFRTTIAWHNRLPFFGHGVWLGVSTGQFPSGLGSEIRTSLRERYQAELDRRQPFTGHNRVAGETGLNHRRPYWLNDSTLVAYVHGYDVRAGFYRIDARTGRRTPIRVQTLTEDRTYSLGADTSSLLAGRYVPDPLVTRQAIAEVERVDLSDGSSTRLTDGARAFAPVEGPGASVYAIQNDGPFTRWVRIGEDRSTEALTPQDARSIRQVAPSPKDSTIAVLVNEDGRQRLYRARVPIESSAQLTPWIGFQDAVIHDVSWGPQGRYLLLAADPDGTSNVFAYDTEAKRMLKVANVRFGALEPALSPDRSTVAFVNYRHERHDLVRMPFRPDSASVVPDSILWTGTAASVPDRDPIPESHPSLDTTEARPYAAWRHLAPRMVYPVLAGEGDDEPLAYLEEPNLEGPLGVGFGLGVQGADPLRRWAYQGTAFWQDGRLWGEARVQSGAFLLRPSISAYDRPFSTFVQDQEGNTFLAGVEERGGALGLRLPVTLRSNVYQTRFRLSLGTEVRQTRVFGGRLREPTDFTTRATLNPRAVFGYRLQQNPRDLVPNTGIVLGLQGEVDAWTSEGGASQGLVTSVDTYLPVLRSSHTGIRLGARVLAQNEASIFGTGSFVPRGYEGGLGAGYEVDRQHGTFLQLEAEVTQPLWYIDDGFTLLPLYAKVLSVYGFAETLGTVRKDPWPQALSSVGGGVSLEVRVFYGFGLDLRIGAAYRPQTGDVVTIYR